MPERVSFELFTLDGERFRDRKRLIEGVLAIAPQWFSAPQEMRLLNRKTEEAQHVPWDPESVLLTRTLNPEELLSISVQTPSGRGDSRNNLMFYGVQRGGSSVSRSHARR